MRDTISDLASALARIAELEAELAARPAARRKTGSEPACMYCADTKTQKVTFLGRPLCAEWKPCASRIRSLARKGIILRPSTQKEVAA